MAQVPWPLQSMLQDLSEHETPTNVSMHSQAPSKHFPFPLHSPPFVFHGHSLRVQVLPVQPGLQKHSAPFSFVAAQFPWLPHTAPLGSDGHFNVHASPTKPIGHWHVLVVASQYALCSHFGSQRSCFSVFWHLAPAKGERHKHSILLEPLAVVSRHSPFGKEQSASF
jgi:hypothetical protein